MSYLTSEFWAFVICYRSSWRTLKICINIEFPSCTTGQNTCLNLENRRHYSRYMLEIEHLKILNALYRSESMQSRTKSILHCDWARMPWQRWLPMNLVLDPGTSISIWPKPNPTKHCPQHLHLQSTQMIRVIDWELKHIGHIYWKGNISELNQSRATIHDWWT